MLSELSELQSTGGFNQPEWSPCIYCLKIRLKLTVPNRSDEERFFKLGSEPLTEPLTVADLAGPFFMALAFLGLSLVAFASEVTFGCNVGVATENKGYLRKTRERRRRKKMFKHVEISTQIPLY